MGVPAANTEVDETVAGVAYKRHASVVGNVFTIERSERSLATEFAAVEAAAAQARLRVLADRTVYLQRPRSYRPTAAETAAILASNPADVDGLLERGNLLLDKRRYDDAIADYAAILKREPANATAMADMGLAYAWKGDVAAATRIIAASAALNPRDRTVYHARGVVAEKTSDYKAAITAYTDAIALQPDNSFALERRAGVYKRLGNFQAALADTDALIRLIPSSAGLYVSRAELFRSLGKPADAQAQADAVLAANPATAEAVMAAVQIDLMFGGVQSARRRLDAEIAVRPDASLLAVRGQLPDSGKSADADIAAALKRDPSSSIALMAQAKRLENGGDPRAAIAIWTRLLAELPHEPELLANRALSFKAAGDRGKAVADLDTAIGLDPSKVDLYLLRVNLYDGPDRRAYALAQAAAVVAANPDDDYAHVVAARIYHYHGADDRALRAFDRALAIAPSAYIYLNRSQVRSPDDVAGRLADLDAALKLDPDHMQSLDARSLLQIRTGDYRGALLTLDKMVELRPGSAELLAIRGTAHLRAGNTALAERDFAAGRAAAVTAEQFNEMCWAKARAGVALESALEDCNTALAKAPGSDGILDSRGLVLFRLGRLDAALADYTAALAKAPTQVQSLYGRAFVWAAKGNPEKSRADAAAAIKINKTVAEEFKGYGLTLAP